MDDRPVDRETFPEQVVTRRLILRRPRQDEGEACGLPYARAEATRRLLRAAVRRKFGAFMVGHWNLYGFGFFVVEHRESGEAIGSCGLKYRDAYPGHWPGRFDVVELGYALVPEARGVGYATEAARAVLSVALLSLDVPCIEARCNVENDASARVIERCGMQEIPEHGIRRFQLYRSSAV